MRIQFFLLFFLLPFTSSATLSLEQFQSRPKLVVLLVIDQFRADYLTRFENKFLPAENKNSLGGFRFLMKKGAYFPFAEYDVSQSMTCPGHAMISTGSYPYQNGIPLNEYYDRNEKRMVYCAEDKVDEYSPRNLKTSTFSDEIKNAGIPSKVIGIALKDRSAIMLVGHRADLALWMDYKSLQWRSSTYYTKILPPWVSESNSALKNNKNEEQTWLGHKFNPKSKLGFSLEYGVDVSFSLAEQAVSGENLGRNKGTDILALSLSSHDMLGHTYGPNSPELEALTIFEDKRLAKFLNFLNKHLGSLKNVNIILTADHGIAPTVEYATQAKIQAGKLDYLVLYKKAYDRLDKKFGKAKAEWFVASKYLQFYLNEDLLKEKKLNKVDVENEVKQAFQGTPGISAIFLSTDLEKGFFPPGEIGSQLRRQYFADKSGDIIIRPFPFFMEKDDNVVTHMTSYTYDRTVPLIFFGSKFKAGVYTQSAKVIDLAPTLSFSLGVLPPATNEGKVLQIF